METPKLFLTDYASYNNGTQFEFGHWVELEEFSDADDFLSYIKDHFKQADNKSPLSSPREEVMFTDYENLPSHLYSESLSSNELQKIFNLIDFRDSQGLDSLDNKDDNLLSLWNEYQAENRGTNYIYWFDDEALMMLAGSKPMDIFIAGTNADIRWSDDYIMLNGYGWIVSLSDPSNEIDETLIIDWILETKI
jgi:hypothetical protein